MITKDARRLRVGVLGCGPIAQFAHLESCAKARNAELYAICDAAPDLLARMAATYAVPHAYGDYDAMLANPDVEAVIVATSDAFHVPMSIRALEAGKAVLCEKPIGVSVSEVEELRKVVDRTGRVLQVGHMKRFDPGLEAARDFIQTEIGQLLALKAWYCDSTHRYSMTDAVQPLPVTSRHASKPAENPKADLRRYYMLAHGSHLVDTARFLCGEITEVRARLVERFGAYCWFVETSFRQRRAGASGSDRGGADGLARGLPALRRAWQHRREDLQPLVLPLERRRDLRREGRDLAPPARCRWAFLPAAAGRLRRLRCSTVLRCAAPASRTGSHRSAPWRRSRNRRAAGRPCGSPTRRVPSDAAGHLRQDLPRHRCRHPARCGARGRLRLAPNATWRASACRRCPMRSRMRCWPTLIAAAKASGVAIVALSGTYNMIHPDPTVRADGLRRLGVMLAAARKLEVGLVTLCTGTRDAEDQWRHHPDNAKPAAWADLCREMAQAVQMAEAAGVDLGIEPEQANVVTSAADAKRLIGEMGSPRVRIVLDPANLFELADRTEARAVVAGAIDLLGDRIAMAHAKDRAADGSFTTRRQGRCRFPGLRGAAGCCRLRGADGGAWADRGGGARRGGVPLRADVPMRTDALQRDDATLRVFDSGAGSPVVFQHGLGGDAAQVEENFPDGPSYRRITVECRAQGASTARQRPPVLDRDVCRRRPGGVRCSALRRRRHLDRGRHRPASRGPPSRPGDRADPGAAGLAVRPRRRPTCDRIVEIARLLREHPPLTARERFAASATARMLATEAPDNLTSLLKFFDRPDPAVTADLLADIAADGPGVTAAQAAAITMPTLVIGHADDHVHPLAYAQRLAGALPDARLATITPKASDKPRHVAEFRRAVDEFLQQLIR